MKNDHRPYFIKNFWRRVQEFYVSHKLLPQLTSLGRHPSIGNPWYIEIYGGPIRIGDYIMLLGNADNKTRLTAWSDNKNFDGIRIGHHVLISPGVRISAAGSITIGDSCMLASHVYIMDADWHGIYDRSMSFGTVKPVVLEENVWVGDSALICKGVTIGKNSIIGAGSVVTGDIPSGVIAVGNPARVIKKLDPEKTIITRKDRFEDSYKSMRYLKSVEKELLRENTFFGWVRSVFFPKKQA